MDDVQEEQLCRDCYKQLTTKIEELTKENVRLQEVVDVYKRLLGIGEELPKLEYDDDEDSDDP